MLNVRERKVLDVYFDREDVQLVRDTADLLRSIQDMMSEYKCDTLEGGYEDCRETINAEDINNVIASLDILLDVDQMY